MKVNYKETQLHSWGTRDIFKIEDLHHFCWLEVQYSLEHGNCATLHGAIPDKISDGNIIRIVNMYEKVYINSMRFDEFVERLGLN